MRLFAAFFLFVFMSACASQESLKTLRTPPPAPKGAVVADYNSPLYEAVALTHVSGVTDFVFFDRFSPFTTRPTTRDVEGAFNAYLGQIGLKAPHPSQARFHLSVAFLDVRGPDVVPFSDKEATASIHYTLTDAFTGELVYDSGFTSHFVARMPGITPEMVRGAALGGTIGAITGLSIRDSATSEGEVISWAALGGGIAATAANEKYDGWGARPKPTLFGGIVGALAGQGANDWIETLIEDGQSITVSDLEAAGYGSVFGGLTGLIAAAPKGVAPTSPFKQTSVGSFEGTERRRQAVAAALRQNFAYFAKDLAGEGLGVRQARIVPCAHLNPHGTNGVVFLGRGDVVLQGCN